MNLIEYFEEMYEKIENNWNVESSLKYFGIGKNNEGSNESKSIKRYYVKPNEKCFREIFLNFDENRNIDSIVWFFDKNSFLKIGELKKIFGIFETHNVIYDETTELNFTPKKNKNIRYIQVSILEWIEKSKDEKMFFKKGNEKIEVNDDYKLSFITFKINNSA